MDFIYSRKAMKKLVIMLLLSTLYSSASLAEEVPLVDGNLWLQSDTSYKYSYLVGISNFISVEYGFQKASKQPPTNAQSTVSSFFEDVDDISLEEITKRIDSWYKNNPDEMNMAVLNVIWVDMVKAR